MARGAVAEKARPKAKAAAGRAVSPAKGKGAEDLSDLAASVKELEDVQRAQSGSSLNWLTLVQGNTGIVKQGDPMYIKGAKLLDYVIPSKKLRLGPVLDATVLGMFKLYEQRPPKKGDGMSPTVGFWLPEDAEQVPQTGIFERELANGDLLYPVHWVFLYLHDFPDVEDALLAFRSIGNQVYKDLEKLLKSESTLWSEVRLKITNQSKRNEEHKSTSYYPDFEIAGRNFAYTDDKVSSVKGGLTPPEVRDILTRSGKLQSDYAKAKLVSRRNNIAALIGGSSRPALPASNASYDEDDGDGAVTF
jgi:hypothetical protein